MTTVRQRALPLTETGRARLLDELHRLRIEREPECRERLRDLREGGRPEDLELHLLLEELARVQQRRQELEELLATEPAEYSTHPPGTVTIGSQVTACDDSGRVHRFVLVSPLEAGVVRGHVSTVSPVGAALLGRRAGDSVQVMVPAGRRVFNVLTVAE
jgi:transcription elongation GreA/GreB family factor